MTTPFAVLENLCSRLSSHPELAQRLTQPLGFQIRGNEGGEWTLISTPVPRIEVGISPGTTTLSMSEQLFLDVFERGANPQPAFIRGEILVSGELSSVLESAALFPETRLT